MSDTQAPATEPDPNPFDVGTAEHEIWAGALAIYAGFIAADRAAIDANISPEATMFDSDTMPLIHGRAELDAIRDARPAVGDEEAAAPVLRGLAPEVRVWGDTAVLLHYLAVDLADGSPEQTVRNTSVWRRASGTPTGAPRWLMVHNHEDVTAVHWLPGSHEANGR